MRDLLLLAVVLWGLTKVFGRPYVGTYLWTWISLMNPHQLSYGFAKTFPFAQIIALVTLVGLLTGKQKKNAVFTAETVVLAGLVLWVCLTTVFAIYPQLAFAELERFLKVQLFIFLTVLLIVNKRQLDILIWIVVVSIGFYGVKGGLFTIATGGGARVWGPENSFIGGNNEIALALLMVVPLMNYLRSQVNGRWVKRGLIFSMLLCAAAILGTQSRGAFIGIAAIGVLFWLKSNQKLAATLLVAVVTLGVFLFMPDTWWGRMNTIQTYEEDASAMGRINAWWVAFHLANERITGGGADVFHTQVFYKYAPDPEDVHDVHSIYFEMLGEQGWIGLALFVLLAVLVWRKCSILTKAAKRDPQHKWLADLMPMVQVGLVGYYVSGAFLGLAYLDLYYDLVAIVCIASILYKESTSRYGAVAAI